MLFDVNIDSKEAEGGTQNCVKSTTWYRQINSEAKVKNIPLPVNKLNNADGLNLMRTPPPAPYINTATSSTFFCSYVA